MPTGARVESAVGDGGGDDREIVGGHPDRALPVVQVEGGIRAGVEGSEAVQHVGDRAIAGPRPRLGGIDGLVHREPPAGAGRVEIHDLGKGGDDHALGDVADRRQQQRRRHDGAGVDHRVTWAAPGVDADLVERLPGRFHTDLGVRGHRAETTEHHRIGQRFRDRLDGELVVAVAARVGVPVVHAQREPVTVRVDGRQFRDVIGNLSRPVLGTGVHDVTEIPADVRGHGVESSGPSQQVSRVARRRRRRRRTGTDSRRSVRRDSCAVGRSRPAQ